MQHIDLNAAKAAKASDRKSLAILAYDNATAAPESANWRGVAELLRLALPSTKAKPAETVATDSRFAQWANYDIPQNATKRLGKSPIVVISFADGETVRVPAVSLPGKPVNIGRAIRVALAFYRGRIAHRCGEFSETAGCVMVPDIVSAICETTGAEYDAADCSAKSAELRAGAFNYAATFDASFDNYATAGAENPVDYTRTEYRKAARDMRKAATVAPSEYTDDDREAICEWISRRLAVESAILTATGERYTTAGRAARLAWAVMTLWPDLADSELAAAPVPATSDFRPPSRFLASTSIARDIPGLPVAPLCILRVAA